MSVVEIGAAELPALLAQHDKVLLDFWAPNCMPCLDFHRVLEALAPSYPEWLFGTINIEASPELANQFAIQAVPAIMILRQSTIVYADTGAIDVTGLTALLDQASQLKDEDIHQGS